MKIADPYVLEGDVFETEDSSWTSTFTGFEECPNRTNADWNACAHFELDDGGAGSPFAGEYWVNVGYNIVSFHINEDPDRWEVLSVEVN